jgi:NAD(P)-dependent dehydrogenase (short-subunit alcohol dehydrogenase family)
VEEAGIEDARLVFETNFFGPLRMIKGALPLMRRKGSGIIINVSSIFGLVAMPNNSIYSASKFALEGLSQALRIEVAGQGIKVALVNPGFTMTKFAYNAMESPVMEEYASMRSAGRERVKKNLEDGPDPDIVAEAIQEIIEGEWSEANYIVGEDSSRLLDDWNEMHPDEFARKLGKIFNL